MTHEVEIRNADGTAADLTGCTASAGITRGVNIIRKTPTIEGNIVRTKFTPEETKEMEGLYHIEVKLKDIATDVEVVAREHFSILASIIPDFTA